MGRVELKIELLPRYCPSCRVETQHAVLSQLVGNARKRADGRPYGPKQADELLSACAICNADRFWALRFATVEDAQKLIDEGWTTRIGHGVHSRA